MSGRNQGSQLTNDLFRRALAAAETVSVTGAYVPPPTTSPFQGIAEPIAFFFTPPTADEAEHRLAGGVYSTLYLLRREVQHCLIGTILDEDAVRDYSNAHPEIRSSFATALVLFAGIDLLGKFYDPQANPTKRFTHFATAYITSNRSASEALYKVRCGLMHTFGLLDRDNLTQFTLAYDPHYSLPHATSQVSGRWEVDLGQLYADFIRAHRRYRVHLEDGHPAHNRLRTNFRATFARHGLLHAGARR